MTLKQKIIQWIIVAVIASVVGMSAGGIKEMFGKANEAAPVQYVDSKFIEAREYTDDQNKTQNFNNSKEHNEIRLEVNKKASNEKVDAMLLSLDRVIKQNDKLYLFLLEQGK